MAGERHVRYGYDHLFVIGYGDSIGVSRAIGAVDGSVEVAYGVIANSDVDRAHVAGNLVSIHAHAQFGPGHIAVLHIPAVLLTGGALLRQRRSEPFVPVIVPAEDALLLARGGQDRCYYGHIGIYAGDGKIVHAMDEANGITVSRIGYNGKRILTVRRIFG